MPEMPAGAGERLWLQRERVELEAFFQQLRVVKMPAPDKGRRVPAPLAHGAGALDAHRPEQPGFGPVGTRHKTIRAEHAAPLLLAQWQRAQCVVVAPGVAGAAVQGFQVERLLQAPKTAISAPDPAAEI